MAAFLSDNFPDIAAGTLLIAAVVFALKKIIKDRRRGGCAGCGSFSCSDCASCKGHSENKD